MKFKVGDEFRFWTKEECAEVQKADQQYFGHNTWDEYGVILEVQTTGYRVRIGAIVKEIGFKAALPVHPTEYELALEVLGEDYFA